MAMDVPFSSEVEPTKQLKFGPVAQDTNIRPSDGSSTSSPGQPQVALTKSLELKQFLDQGYSTTELDTLAPKLWLVSTKMKRKKMKSKIDERNKGSDTSILAHIIFAPSGSSRTTNPATENPQFHLIWYYDRLYIKPIPRYLLSYAFWNFLSTQPIELRRAITSSLPTYYISVISDYIATNNKHQLTLIPKDDGSDASDHITFERFARFVDPFQKLPDDSVSPGYRYGELRLSRRNICARIFLRKLTFHHIDAQWGAYLGRFLAPIFSFFAVLSVALNAMQVELGVQGSLQHSLPRWTYFVNVSRWFSCLVEYLSLS